MLIIAVTLGQGLSPEAWNAIIVAIVGSFGTFVVSRYTAKRQADREESDDGSRFRGELRDDNAALRQELREVKEERDRIKERLDEVEEELYRLQVERRKRQKLDQRGPRGREQEDREEREAADLATDVRQNIHLSDPHGERNPLADKIVKEKESK